MNKKIHILFLVSLIAFFSKTDTVLAQNWDMDLGNKFWDTWSVNINAGLTSYYGDLSLYDSEFSEKLKKESGPALGFIINKNFSNSFSLSGQLLYGNIGCINDNIEIISKFIEYNFHFRIDFVSLAMQNKPHKFGIIGYAGIGQFLFDTEKIEYFEGYSESNRHNTGVPEFVYFAGGSIYYKVNENIGITADLGLRQCQNDKLDDYVKENDFDYYTYLSVGVTYYIQTFVKKTPKNKARIAHNNHRHKSLNKRHDNKLKRLDPLN